MLQKIVYSVVFDGDTYNARQEGMLKVRASQGKNFVDIPTDIYIKQGCFSDGRINKLHPQYEGLNAMLSQIILNIQATEIDAFKNDVEMTCQKIYSMYYEHMNINVTLVEFLEAVLAYSPNRREVTKRKYRDSIKIVNEYCPNVKLEDIDLQFLKKFETYCYKKGNSDSTIWSHMKGIRMLFNEAIRRDLLKPWQTPFRFYVIPQIRSRTDILRWAEIEQLHNFHFIDRRYNHIRDLFCFACYTGLRVGDLMRLKADNIRKIGDVTWLQINTNKTGAYVQIPLSIIFYGNALDILKRYKNVEELVGYKDRTSINKAIKKMLEITNIGGNQQVSIHTARRSCITALADFGVNVYTIQKLVGHQRIETTRKYMVLSTASLENDLRKAFPTNGSKIQTDNTVIYKCKDGTLLYKDSPKLCCNQCAHAKQINKYSKAWYCSIIHGKTKSFHWCEKYKERL